jgi:hypothetical protein
MESKLAKTAAKLGEKMLDEVGVGFAGGLARGIFTEDKGREPVVPDDLHLVKAAPVDADGNVDCIYCRGKVAFAAASLIGSAGYACARCVAQTHQPVELPADVRIRRGPVPYLIAAGVVALAVAIVVVAMQ